MNYINMDISIKTHADVETLDELLLNKIFNGLLDKYNKEEHIEDNNLEFRVYHIFKDFDTTYHCIIFGTYENKELKYGIVNEICDVFRENKDFYIVDTIINGESIINKELKEKLKFTCSEDYEHKKPIFLSEDLTFSLQRRKGNSTKAIILNLNDKDEVFSEVELNIPVDLNLNFSVSN